MRYGLYNETQIIPSEWINESLQTYSSNVYPQLGTYFRNAGYGYMCWSANVSNHSFNYAWDNDHS